MKIKLIESGGFAGLRKVAEEDLSDHPEALKEHIENAFAQPKPAVNANSAARDKEQLHLELDGKVLPLNAIEESGELKELIQKLKSNLQYGK
jgi:hypothetical protein